MNNPKPTIAYKILLTSEYSSWLSTPPSNPQGSTSPVQFFTGAGIDLKDGFIHLSTAAQLSDTYSKWFAARNPAEASLDADAKSDTGAEPDAGPSTDAATKQSVAISPGITGAKPDTAGPGEPLVLVEIDLTKILGRVEWEAAPSRQGEEFAHVYGGGIPYVRPEEDVGGVSAVMRVWEGGEVRGGLMGRIAEGGR